MYINKKRTFKSFNEKSKFHGFPLYGSTVLDRKKDQIDALTYGLIGMPRTSSLNLDECIAVKSIKDDYIIINFDINGSLCITPCSMRPDEVYVGSATCARDCSNFISVDNDKKIVRCKGKKI